MHVWSIMFKKASKLLVRGNQAFALLFLPLFRLFTAMIQVTFLYIVIVSFLGGRDLLNSSIYMYVWSTLKCQCGQVVVCNDKIRSNGWIKVAISAAEAI